MQKKQIIMKQLLYNKAIKKYISIDIVCSSQCDIC